MGGVALALLWSRQASGPAGAPGRWRAELARGAAAGLAVQLAVEQVFGPVYSSPTTTPRLILFGAFLVLALPAFAATAAACTLVRGGRLVGGAPIELLLGAVTIALAMPWFARMSALPILLLGGTLLFAGAYRAHGRAPLAAAAFAAVMYARAAADVCAFH